MGIFKNFKAIFVKPLTIKQKQREDVVSLVKNRFGRLKCGTPLQVDENYKLCATHFNEVADVLSAGTHTISAEDMPKLFRICKNSLLKSNSKYIWADLYFVNLKLFENNSFKTHGNIFANTYKGKVGIKINGSFSFKIFDCKKFMQFFCDEYAIVKSKTVFNNIETLLGEEITFILRKNLFELDCYVKNSQKVRELIKQQLEKLENKLGVKFENIEILRVDAPQKFEREIQVAKAVVSVEDDLILQAEKASEGEGEKVFVNANREQKNSPFVETQNSFENSSNSTSTFRQTKPQFNFNNASYTTSENSFQPDPVVVSMQKEPTIIAENKTKPKEKKLKGERKRTSQNGEVEIISPEEAEKLNTTLCKQCGAKMSINDLFCPKCGASCDLKTCPCCGAKNVHTSTECCVCKSKF